jgi:hypothetical protein
MLRGKPLYVPNPSPVSGLLDQKVVYLFKTNVSGDQVNQQLDSNLNCLPVDASNDACLAMFGFRGNSTSSI